MLVIPGRRAGMGALSNPAQTLIPVTVTPKPVTTTTSTGATVTMQPKPTTLFIATSGALTNIGAASIIKQAQSTGSAAVTPPPAQGWQPAVAMPTPVVPATPASVAPHPTSPPPPPFTGISQAQIAATAAPTIFPPSPSPAPPPSAAIWQGTPGDQFTPEITVHGTMQGTPVSARTVAAPFSTTGLIAMGGGVALAGVGLWKGGRWHVLTAAGALLAVWGAFKRWSGGIGIG